MKKSISFLLMVIVVLSIFSCENGNKINDLTKANLRGNVKYIKEKTYYVSEKYGQLIKGEIEEYELILFDKKGNIIEEKKYSNYYQDNYIKKYKYDKKGNKIEHNWYNLDGEIDRKGVFEYDSKGNNIEESWYDINDNLCTKKVFKYDSKGNNIEYYRYFSDGNLHSKEICQFDSMSNKIKETLYHKNDTTELSYKNKYDLNGKLLETNVYSSEGSLEKSIKYDLKGNIINSNETNKYDTNGNIIEVFVNNISTSIIDYLYDDKGNWIRKNIKGGDKVTERKIVYYDEDDKDSYSEYENDWTKFTKEKNKDNLAVESTKIKQKKLLNDINDCFGIYKSSEDGEFSLHIKNGKVFANIIQHRAYGLLDIPTTYKDGILRIKSKGFDNDEFLCDFEYILSHIGKGEFIVTCIEFRGRNEDITTYKIKRFPTPRILLNDVVNYEYTYAYPYTCMANRNSYPYKGKYVITINKKNKTITAKFSADNMNEVIITSRIIEQSTTVDGMSFSTTKGDVYVTNENISMSNPTFRLDDDMYLGGDFMEYFNKNKENIIFRFIDFK